MKAKIQKAKKPQFRLFDFQVSENRLGNEKKTFLIKMFGMNTKGKTFCIFAKNFKPFFYVLGEDDDKNIGLKPNNFLHDNVD